MANVTWIKGTNNPPESGNYYVILEAQQDMNDPYTGEMLFHAGDIEVDGDWYDHVDGFWESLGDDNPFWRVLFWGMELNPSIPEDIRPRVKWYFGTEVNGNG